MLSNPKVNINWSKISLIAQLILLAFIAGVGSWFTKGFDPSYIGSSEWYADTLTQIMYNYLTLFSVFQYRLGVIRKTTKEYNEYLITVNKAASRLDPGLLNSWLVRFNTNRIIKEHINKFQFKLDKLEKNASTKDIVIWDKGTPEEKSKNRYCKRKTKYLLYISTEYIEENRYIIRTSSVSNIKNIKSAFITRGFNDKSRGDNWNIQTSGSKFFKDLLPKTILTTLVVIILRSIILDIAQVENTLLMLVNTILILVPMGIHGNVGWTYADQFHREKDLVDLRKREELIALHLKETKVGEDNGIQIN